MARPVSSFAVDWFSSANYDWADEDDFLFDLATYPLWGEATRHLTTTTH